MRYIRLLVLAILVGFLALSGSLVTTTAQVSSPSRFEEIGQLDLSAKKAVFEADLGYVIGGGCRSEGTPPQVTCEGTFTVLDVAASPTPAILAQRELTGESFEDVAVSGNYAYTVVRSESPYSTPAVLRLAVIDVAPGTPPTEVAYVDIEDGTRNFDSAIVGSYLFLSSNAGIVIYDLANPTAPVEASRIDVSAAGIDVEGTTLFVASQGGFYGFDISAPTAPVEVTTVPGDLKDIEVFGDRAFTVATKYCGTPDQPLPVPCGTFLLEFDVSDLSNPVKRTYDIGGQYVTLHSIGKFNEFLLIGDGASLRAFNLRLPELNEVARYHAKVGEGFSTFLDIDVYQKRIFTLTWVNEETALRVLQLEAPVTSFLAFITNTSQAYAQGPDEERFGIGEADYGSAINWSGQNYYWAWSYDWPPDQSTGWRRVYTGPDIIGTWVFAHSPDYYSEGTGHFGANFSGPVSNGASDPLSDGIDLFWVSNNHGDMAIEGSIASAEYTDGNGHTYNRNHHSLLGPGGHHLHDTNGNQYVDCYDIEGFDLNNAIATCDAINQTGANDGVYVHRLNDFLNFVVANPGRVWTIGQVTATTTPTVRLTPTATTPATVYLPLISRNPGSPTPIPPPIPLGPPALYVLGGRAYVGWNVCCNDKILEVLDVTDPADPVGLGREQIPDTTYIRLDRVRAAEGYAYIGSTYGVYILQVSDPSTIRFIRHIGILGEGGADYSHFLLHNQHIYRPWYQGDGGSGLSVYDVSNPLDPQYYELPAFVTRGADAFDDHLIGSSMDQEDRRGDQILVVNVSNPISPTIVAQIDAPMERGAPVAEPLNFVTESNRAYAYKRKPDITMWGIDILAPDAPEVVGSHTLPGMIRDVASKDERVYVLTSMRREVFNADTLWVVDASVPDAPVTLGSYSNPPQQGGPAWGDKLTVVGWYVYIPTSHGIHVLDATDPTNIVEAGVYAEPEGTDDADLLSPYR